MSVTRYFVVALFCVLSLHAFSQPGTSIELTKPEKYENRTLASEKTPDRKIGAAKRIYQNTITHYNYFFNANNIINDIIDKAKQANHDNFDSLLSYYNYSLDVTQTDNQIDTVIYKCNAGILLHDLRNDWVDDMYFLLGQAYYLRKNFDSAAHVFQYVNYAFGPKDKDNYDIPIGSNESNTNGQFSIATKEKGNIVKKAVSTPPRRNENLLWQAKNFIAMGNVGEGGSILEMLRYDPNFPERLRPELNEALGYVFYLSRMYDSAAAHLVKSIKISDDKQNQARREYLAAQLYQLSGNSEDASDYFARSASHSLDPLMAVYASINSIQTSGADSASKTQLRINELTRLAHKERFYKYRDIIYYTAAKAELELGRKENAYDDLKKSIRFSQENPEQKSRSFLLLGDLDYEKSVFHDSRNEYDSVEQSSLTDAQEQTRLSYRLPPLQTIDDNFTSVHEEDSLQLVAKMPEGERTALIRKTVRRLRKEQGLKEEDETPFVNPAVQMGAGQIGGQSAAPVDLFSAQNAKGDWYFNNTQLKSSGFNTFRVSWGNRPNVDNWQRMDAVSKQAVQAAQDQTGTGEPDSEGDGDERMGGRRPPLQRGPVDALSAGTEITYDALLANVPLSEDQLGESNRKIADALFENGMQFQNELENYPAAIDAYNELLRRFPKTEHAEQTLFNLYFCYSKTGKRQQADSAKQALTQLNNNSDYAKLMNGKAGASEETIATKTYEDIYDLFISGSFKEALAKKAAADSTFGDKYWTPQLLYIESIYHLSERNDSAAINTLNSLAENFQGTPLAERALRMIDVINRRGEIEDYLTKLQITRNEDTTVSKVITLKPIENLVDKKVVKVDSVVSKPITAVARPKVDSVAGPSTATRTYAFNANDQQFVAIVLNKVASVYVNEAKNAFARYNQMTFYNQKLDASVQKLNDSLNVVLIGPMADASAAFQYIEKSKPQAPGRIIPWLKPDKYSFIMISPANFEVLKATNDLESYRQLLNTIMPGKF